MTQIRIGYVPLTDAALLIAAAERGFAAREGLDLVLERENSWATLRDKLALGHLDGAHLLAPLAIAMAVGLGPAAATPLSVPFLLSRNGNAIAASTALSSEMGVHGSSLSDIREGLGRVGIAHAREGRPLRLASVFPYSGHTLLLRRLLDGTGLDPERDVAFTVVPPPYSAVALSEGAVDVVCVGAPWPSVAVDAGAGHILALGPHILPDMPEKVLALARDRLPPATVSCLVASLKQAAAWCGEPANRDDLADLLAQPRHLGQSPALIARALEGRLLVDRDGSETVEASYLRFGGALHRPDPAIADWIMAEMERCGQTRFDDSAAETARALFESSSFDCS